MDMPGYVDEIKFRLTGGVLDLEISDADIQKAVEYSLRAIQRYIHNTKFVTVPFSSCIDVSEYHISEVRFVYIGQANYGVTTLDTGNKYGDATNVAGQTSIYANAPIDPMAWSAFYLGAPGMVSGYTNYVDNYYAYNQTLKSLNIGNMKQLTFNYNKADEKLYINKNVNCSYITIEYVPRFDSVDEVTSDAWIDILLRYALANVKIALGRVRTRFTQSNALWTQDGETLLAEGNQELADLRNYLDASASVLRPR